MFRVAFSRNNHFHTSKHSISFTSSIRRYSTSNNVSIEQITPNIYKIGPSNPAKSKTEPCNTYLINNSVLIDPATKESLEKALEITNSIKAVLYTHHHPRHFAPSLLQEVSLKDAELVNLPTKDYQFKPWNKHGIRAIYTPGHTITSVCYKIEQDDAICTGDAIFTIPLTINQSDPEFQIPLTSMVSQDVAAYFKSLNHLLREMPKFILPGHGSPVLPFQVISTLERALEVPLILERRILTILKRLGARGRLVPTKEVVEEMIKACPEEDATILTGIVYQELVRLESIKSITRHDAKPSIDPKTVHGPGGLNMEQVFNLIQDRKAKDEQHYGPSKVRKPMLGELVKDIHPCHAHLEDVRKQTWDLLL